MSDRIFDKYIRYSIPVSYTHLDVYKRQTHYSTDRTDIDDFSSSCLAHIRQHHFAHVHYAEEISIHPVSYTHLDVYKRQQKHSLSQS